MGAGVWFDAGFPCEEVCVSFGSESTYFVLMWIMFLSQGDKVTAGSTLRWVEICFHSAILVHPYQHIGSQLPRETSWNPKPLNPFTSEYKPARRLVGCLRVPPQENCL